MAKTNLPRVFDVRADRLDLRDREYRPPLTALPEEYPPPAAWKVFLSAYRAMILDQGTEGACTGFGLACVINFLLWSRQWRQPALLGLEFPAPQPIQRVSPRMLYHLARFYDEWPGEDYEGSSCRGAMKGWHRHGVCSEALWPYSDKRGRFVPPRKGWQEDAALRTLGAYYRIDRKSVNDLQAAVYETGAVYVSADVHAGWKVRKNAPTLPVIRLGDAPIGGHAFAIVGYTVDGFIIQNSWGGDWGYHGFAILTYEDWVQHGMDAWAAALGVPAGAAQAVGGGKKSSMAFRGAAFGVPDRNERAGVWLFGGDKRIPHEYQDPCVAPWSDERAFQCMLVMGNNGQPLNRLVPCEDATAAVEQVCEALPSDWLDGPARKTLMIYAHGGLNAEQDALNRTRILAPYFYENGIYPLFIAWRTGFLETLGQIWKDSLPDARSLTGERAGGLSGDVRGWYGGLSERLADARDRTVELVCERLVKPIWSQMKQNAAASAASGQGLALLAKHLQRLAARHAGLAIHLVGHSAGSILHGHLLGLLRRARLTATSCTLYAPACTLRFALDYYGEAIRRGVLAPRALHVENLTDARELADSIGPYGKSLLYLVSRALEDFHKMPLLGREREWKPADDPEASFGEAGARDYQDWQSFVRTHRLRQPVWLASATVSDGLGDIPAAHGSFDNDVAVITHTIERIKDGPAKPVVECLRGF